MIYVNIARNRAKKRHSHVSLAPPLPSRDIMISLHKQFIGYYSNMHRLYVIIKKKIKVKVCYNYGAYATTMPHNCCVTRQGGRTIAIERVLMCPSLSSICHSEGGNRN